MKPAEIIPRLETWARRIRSASDQIDALHKVTGMCDGPLVEAIWHLQDAYTDATSALVGDANEWLDYYRNECAMGTKPREIQSWGGRKMKLKTLKQLASVIAEESADDMQARQQAGRG
jgi:hypothetical protein